MTEYQTGSPVGAGMGRRRFLQCLAGTPALVLVAQLADLGHADHAGAAPPSPPTMEELCDISEFIVVASQPTMPLVKLEIGPDGIARLDLPRAEMGQGITTSVAMLLAEDLDVGLDKVVVTIADGRPELMFNQMTAGSCTLRTFQAPLQMMAATARAQMLHAAAARWNVLPAALTVRDGVVIGPDGRRATYGELAEEAAKVPVDGLVVTPKSATDYTIVGKPTRRVDARDIVTGAKKFSMDRMPTSAKPAMVKRGPTVKAGVKSVNNAGVVKAMPGVRAIVPIPTGVAVVADTFEQCREAVNALDVTFGPGPIDHESNETILAALQAQLQPFDPPPAGDKVVEAEFDFAPVNHAFMEAECAVADVKADSAEIWSGFQAPILALQSIALELGLPQEKVKAHVVPPGGGFGRRVFFDAPLEAAQISRGAGMPVRLMWHRTDDFRHGRCRPQQVHRFRAVLAGASVIGFEQKVAAVSTDFRQGLGEILTAAAASMPFDAKQTIGNSSFAQGVFTTMVSSPYVFGGYKKGLTELANGQPTASYRSVPCQPARGAEEIMVDEVAAAAGIDPVAFRMSWLKDDRTKEVMQKAAELAEWGKPMPPGFAQGIGVHIEGRCHTACIVELDGRNPRDPKVTRAVMTVDVGLPVNPMTIEAQMLGGISEAISLTLRAGLHFVDGLPLEGSFHQYHWLRQRDFPKDVTIHVMPANGNPIGGIGEVGMAAPTGAIANAYGKATGIKPRSFPLIFPVNFEPYPPGYLPPPAYKDR
ncbi:MAG TPA: molybdopterin cofactor-binding domain-containing protein [Acidimicrobiia bacterium]|nr:molybdopterin cofactor-binding domain-containing protein [Acidimicrobiia bacterium]